VDASWSFGATLAPPAIRQKMTGPEAGKHFLIVEATAAHALVDSKADSLSCLFSISFPVGPPQYSPMFSSGNLLFVRDGTSAELRLTPNTFPRLLSWGLYVGSRVLSLILRISSSPIIARPHNTACVSQSVHVSFSLWSRQDGLLRNIGRFSTQYCQ